MLIKHNSFDVLVIRNRHNKYHNTHSDTDILTDRDTKWSHRVAVLLKNAKVIE